MEHPPPEALQLSSADVGRGAAGEGPPSLSPRPPPLETLDPYADGGRRRRRRGVNGSHDGSASSPASSLSHFVRPSFADSLSVLPRRRGRPSTDGAADRRRSHSPASSGGSRSQSTPSSSLLSDNPLDMSRGERLRSTAAIAKTHSRAVRHKAHWKNRSTLPIELLTVRYLLALAVIGALMVLGQALTQTLFFFQSSDPHICHAAQETASVLEHAAQSAAWLDDPVAGLHHSSLEDDIRSIIDRTTGVISELVDRRMVTGFDNATHSVVLSQSLYSGATELQAILVDIKGQFDAGSPALGRAQIPVAVARARDLSLLANRESVERISTLSWTQVAITLLLGGVLAAQGIWVFRPSVRRLEEEFKMRVEHEVTAVEREVEQRVNLQLRAEALVSVSEAILSDINLNTLLPRLVEVSRGLLDCDKSNLFLYDDSTDSLLSWSASVDSDPESAEGDLAGTASLAGSGVLKSSFHGVDGRIEVVPRDSLMGACLDNKTVVAVVQVGDEFPRLEVFHDDIEIDPVLGQREIERINIDIPKDAAVKGVVMCAIFQDEKPLGVIEFIKSGKHRRDLFADEDLEMARVFASQASVGLLNSRLHHATVHTLTFMDAILQCMRDAVLVVGEGEGTVLQSNRAADNLFGQASKLGEIFQESREGNEMLLGDIRRALEEGRTAVREDVNVTVRDQTPTLNYSSYPMQTTTGDSLGACVLVAEDISEAKRVRSTLSRYLSPAVAEQMMLEGANVGGTETEATVLFSDIRSFTSLSEALGPTQVVEMLNTYFEEMVDSIYEHNGILDKFIGDAVMSVFGVPFSDSMDATNACHCALDMMERLARLNARRATEGQQAIRVGIGVNSGRVVSGNIGSAKRLEYTVIGDTTNLASRIEGASKFYGVKILISEFTLAQVVPGEFVVREVDRIRVVGKTQPIRVYELVGRAKDGAQCAVDLDAFDAAIGHYFAGAFGAAEAALAALPAGDRPTEIIRERCIRFLEDESLVPADWTGVWTMESK